MRILIAPLDWGLGHATRCMPLIDHLLDRGAEPVLGCAGGAGALLRREYPELPYVDLPPNHIRYDGTSLALAVARQIPRFLFNRRREHLIVQELVRRHRIRGILSDNRYGCYSRRVPSVLLTHQLHPRVPVAWLDRPVQAVLGGWIRRFDACWVPDSAGEPSLAGALAHPARHPRTAYLGPLSRLLPAPPGATDPYDLLCLLSGPEPERTRLEALLLPQLRGSGLRVALVRGKPAEEGHHRSGNLEVWDHCLAEELDQLMAASRLVLCRSGYSTLMDLRAAGQRAVLIPTPGQTEQIYLADRLHDAGICYRVDQAGFRLDHALRASEDYAGFGPPDPAEGPSFEPVLDAWLDQLDRPLN